MQQREKSKNQQVLAYASILTAAALWGIIGIWNRNLMGLGLSPTGIVLVRNLGGMVALVALFALKDRSVFRVKREHLKYFLELNLPDLYL